MTASPRTAGGRDTVDDSFAESRDLEATAVLPRRGRAESQPGIPTQESRRPGSPIRPPWQKGGAPIRGQCVPHASLAIACRPPMRRCYT